MTSVAPHPSLAAAALEALPAAVLVVDGALRVVHANAAARAALPLSAGVALGDAFGCTEAGAGPCGAGPRCAGCAIRDAVERALSGEAVRTRGFVLRTGPTGQPADLHVLAATAPLGAGGTRQAVLLVEDADRLLQDPAIVRICAGCGKVEDDEGGWHPLHRYLEDRLGLALEHLCPGCGGEGGRRRRTRRRPPPA